MFSRANCFPKKDLVQMKPFLWKQSGVFRYYHLIVQLVIPDGADQNEFDKKMLVNVGKKKQDSFNTIIVSIKQTNHHGLWFFFTFQDNFFKTKTFEIFLHAFFHYGIFFIKIQNSFSWFFNDQFGHNIFIYRYFFRWFFHNKRHFIFT